MNKWKKCSALLGIALAIQMFATEPSEIVNFSWKHSPSTNVNAYIMHYGSTATNLNLRRTFQYTTNGIIGGFYPDSVYYFTITAAVTNANNTNIVESIFSNKVEYRIPSNTLPSTNLPTIVKDFMILKVQ